MSTSKPVVIVRTTIERTNPIADADDLIVEVSATIPNPESGLLEQVMNTVRKSAFDVYQVTTSPF